ncbi:hypothetical protein BASA81_004141 [Batrachochytrium salamandrivorans]|nr:hypothetical protein BASA81_004141 [Batrachochytrium salamandrivorans]
MDKELLVLPEGTSREADPEVLLEAFFTTLHAEGTGKLDLLLTRAIGMAAGEEVPMELVFDLIGDAVEMSTTKEIETQIWPVVVEPKLNQLLELILSSPKQRPQLSLLRASNELLKRVINPVLLGKVLVWVACSLPLADRSGFNSNGAYFENKLALTNPRDRFWKLQAYFASPNSAVDFRDLSLCIEHVLVSFEMAVAATGNVDLQLDSLLAGDGVRYLQGGEAVTIQSQTSEFRHAVLVQLVYYLQTLPVQHLDLTRAWEKRSLVLLGQKLALSIRQQLIRERVWEKWKKEKCVMPTAAVPTAAPSEAAEVSSSRSQPRPQFLAQIFQPTIQDPPSAADQASSSVSVWSRMRKCRNRSLAEVGQIAQSELLPSNSDDGELLEETEATEATEATEESSKRARVE